MMFLDRSGNLILCGSKSCNQGFLTSTGCVTTTATITDNAASKRQRVPS